MCSSRKRVIRELQASWCSSNIFRAIHRLMRINRALSCVQFLLVNLLITHTHTRYERVNRMSSKESESVSLEIE